MGIVRSALLYLIISTPLLLSEEPSSELQQPPTLGNSLIKETILAENHSITLQGTKISYDVHGGSITVKSKTGKESADVHFIAYFARHPKEADKRPIAFCFNGGPGSSSVWLHMGFLGPKIVTIPTQSTNPIPSYQENPLSLLAASDLVFIDPVSTGFSRASDVEGEKKFCGVEVDIRATADFIQLFLSKFHRWQSPKLLIGESYGTARAVGLTHLLQSEYFVTIDGLVLISLVLDLQTLEDQPSKDLVNVLNLPTFAAVAQYHKKLGPPYSEMSLKDLSEKVSSFALNEYAPVLMAGNRAQEEKSESIAQRLCEFTSLPLDFFRSHNLRLGPHQFRKKLLKEKGSIVGRYDGRMTTWNPPTEPSVSGTMSDELLDPTFHSVSSFFNKALNEYLAGELHWEKNEPYIILNIPTNLSWNWNTKTSSPGCGYASFLQDLRISFAKNPRLKVFVAAGYYDFATPFFAQQYSLDHLFLPKPLDKNITFKVYEGGHMMYLDEGPRKELASDLFLFLKKLG